MLKILAIFSLSLIVLPVKTYPQPHKAQDASEGGKPTLSTPKITPEQSSSAAVQKESQKQGPYDVRIISTPQKDAYDDISLFINVALALVGIVGVVVAVCTLRKIERQTRATEDAVSAAHNSYALTEATAKRQLRAYFGAAEGKLYIRDDGSVEPRVTLTNCGQTPAYDLRVIESGRFETRPFKKIPRPDQSRVRPNTTHIVGLEAGEEMSIFRHVNSVTQSLPLVSPKCSATRTR